MEPAKGENYLCVYYCYHYHYSQVPNQRIELVFLVDASASVGAENFFNEIKFVKKLLADFAVSYNQTRVAVVTFSSKHKVREARGIRVYSYKRGLL